MMDQLPQKIPTFDFWLLLLNLEPLPLCCYDNYDKAAYIDSSYL